MHFVSEVGEVLMFKLAAWELLGREDYNPRDLLRSLPFADLELISKNITEETKYFLSVNMVQVEMMYRTGRLEGDWEPSRDGARYTLSPYQHTQQGASA